MTSSLYPDGPPLTPPCSSPWYRHPSDTTHALSPLAYIIHQLSTLLLYPGVHPAPTSPLLPSSPLPSLTHLQLVAALSNVVYTSLRLVSPPVSLIPSPPSPTQPFAAVANAAEASGISIPSSPPPAHDAAQRSLYLPLTSAVASSSASSLTNTTRTTSATSPSSSPRFSIRVLTSLTEIRTALPKRLSESSHFSAPRAKSPKDRRAKPHAPRSPQSARAHQSHHQLDASSAPSPPFTSSTNALTTINPFAPLCVDDAPHTYPDPSPIASLPPLPPGPSSPSALSPSTPTPTTATDITTTSSCAPQHGEHSPAVDILLATQPLDAPCAHYASPSTAPAVISAPSAREPDASISCDSPTSPSPLSSFPVPSPSPSSPTPPSSAVTSSTALSTAPTSCASQHGECSPAVDTLLATQPSDASCVHNASPSTAPAVVTAPYAHETVSMSSVLVTSLSSPSPSSALSPTSPSAADLLSSPTPPSASSLPAVHRPATRSMTAGAITPSAPSSSPSSSSHLPSYPSSPSPTGPTSSPALRVSLLRPAVAQTAVSPRRALPHALPSRRGHLQLHAISCVRSFRARADGEGAVPGSSLPGLHPRPPHVPLAYSA